MKWLAYFGALNAAFFAAIIFVVWLVGGFEGNTVGPGGTAVMALGALVTMALGTGLMGLVFYSNREDVDERVYHVTDREEPQPTRNR